MRHPIFRYVVERLAVGGAMAVLASIPVALVLMIAVILGRLLDGSPSQWSVVAFGMFLVVFGVFVILIGGWIYPEVRRVVLNWLRL